VAGPRWGGSLVYEATFALYACTWLGRGHARFLLGYCFQGSPSGRSSMGPHQTQPAGSCGMHMRSGPHCAEPTGGLSHRARQLRLLALKLLGVPCLA